MLYIVQVIFQTPQRVRLRFRVTVKLAPAEDAWLHRPLLPVKRNQIRQELIELNPLRLRTDQSHLASDQVQNLRQASEHVSCKQAGQKIAVLGRAPEFVEIKGNSM